MSKLFDHEQLSLINRRREVPEEFVPYQTVNTHGNRVW